MFDFFIIVVSRASTIAKMLRSKCNSRGKTRDVVGEWKIDLKLKDRELEVEIN